MGLCVSVEASPECLWEAHNEVLISRAGANTAPPQGAHQIENIAKLLCTQRFDFWIVSVPQREDGPRLAVVQD